MRGYDFTYEPGQATGAPLPGMMAGRWWARDYRELATPQARARAMASYAIEITQTLPQTPPALQRVPVLDTEGCPPAECESIIAECLARLGERLLTRCLVIGNWWAGFPPHFSFQQIVKALEGPASGDRAEMFATARRHRPIVRAAGVVTMLGTIDRPDGSTGPNGEYGTSFYLRKIIAQAKFCRAAWPGTELCLWTCGAYTRLDKFPELSRADCERVADVIWEHYDSFALYGEKPQTRLLGDELSARLVAQSN